MKKLLILFFVLFISIFLFKKIDKKDSQNLNSKKEIIFSISPRMYPFEFYNENKEVDGFDADYAKLLGKKLNRNVVIDDTPIPASFKLLDMNEFDAIISTIVLSDYRKKRNEKEFLLSDSYLEDDMIILFLEKNKKNSIKDFENSVINCPYGCFLFEDWFLENLPNAKQAQFANPSLDLKALNEGKTDGILINKHEGFYLLGKYPDKLNFLETSLKVNYTILVNKNNYKLLEEINKAIKEINDSEELKNLKIKWKLM
jgi:ABC-type amino acid transport substrate-binding protein